MGNGIQLHGMYVFHMERNEIADRLVTEDKDSLALT